MPTLLPLWSSPWVTEYWLGKKQRAWLREGMHALNQEFVASLQASVDSSHDGRLARVSKLSWNHFKWLIEISWGNHPKAASWECKTYWEIWNLKLNSIKNFDHRFLQQLVNVCKGFEVGKDLINFVAELLKETMGKNFDKLDIKCACHGPVLKCKPSEPPRSMTVCFHRYQENELVLCWATMSWNFRRKP